MLSRFRCRLVCKYWNLKVINLQTKQHISLQYYSSSRYIHTFTNTHSMSTRKKEVIIPSSQPYNHAWYTTLNPTSPNPTLLDIEDVTQNKLTPKINYEIPSDYNWKETSAKNYSIKYDPIDFINYEYSKSLIDYTYHGYYTKERQEKVHNPIIDYYKAIAINKV